MLMVFRASEKLISVPQTIGMKVKTVSPMTMGATNRMNAMLASVRVRRHQGTFTT
jgi:hypothetical protein